MDKVAGRLRRRVDLVLHIGSGKTGTTSLQFLLGTNRAVLARHGWLYPVAPSNNRHRHSHFGTFVQPDERLVRAAGHQQGRPVSPTAYRNDLTTRLHAEIREAGLPGLILSDEALYGSSAEAIERLRDFTDRTAASVRLVVYLRRQDDHLVSRYQQVVRMGETRRLLQRTREVDFSDPYDYHARLSTWRRILAPTDFVVRRFEPDRFVRGSLYEDFVDAAGLGVGPDELRPVTVQNESLDAESVEFLRLLNLHRVENEGATDGMINNRQHVLRLARYSTGPVLSLPEAVLEDFMATWAESNAAVARDFLGDGTGELFAAPRRVQDVTTEQVLDPDRLDHFVDLLDLPERVRAPLRRIAEREASAFP